MLFCYGRNHRGTWLEKETLREGMPLIKNTMRSLLVEQITDRELDAVGGSRVLKVLRS